MIAQELITSAEAVFYLGAIGLFVTAAVLLDRHLGVGAAIGGVIVLLILLFAGRFQ